MTPDVQEVRLLQGPQVEVISGAITWTNIDTFPFIDVPGLLIYRKPGAILGKPWNNPHKPSPWVLVSLQRQVNVRFSEILTEIRVGN